MNQGDYEMKKMRMPGAILVLFAILLSGCGKSKVPKDIRESTLVIDSNSRVTAYLVEEFDKNYYNLSELTTMAQMQAAEFAGVQFVSVENVQDDNSRVVINYQFDETDSYEKFTGDELFYGTVAEVIQQGYDSGISMLSVKDGSILTTEKLLQKLGQHFIIYYPIPVKPEEVKLNPESEEHRQISIYCPEAVEYVSQGAVVNQDGSITISWVLGNDYIPVYILLKK